ncbi:hypothetical protein BK126_26560 [Paenibacillus sp. FSL H7-0326]|uniref:hypothetical protein n=1 Tax=Paenibacillus sp. FSL H7-0326 TaxID=1921144 RepID=UPI00096FC21F|nr:hypothetical protein [Paenibacillus sp. FSL H7-0326]OMC63758.1 hypothetical protein BK126_26560 [Paenibacillus sp. FSL H7-0326]
MREIKISVPFLVLFIITVILAFYTVNLKNEQRDMIGDRRKMQEIEAAREANEQFITTLLEYKDVSSRFEKLEPLMTKSGFEQIKPSQEPAAGDSYVVSTILSQQNFISERVDDEFHLFNEISISINYEGSKTEQTVIAKTDLIYEEGEWKVNHYEQIPMLDPSMVELEEHDHGH